MPKINIFNWGSLGVDIVKSPIHLPDGAWTTAQNAEFPTDQGQGGLKKRGSLTRVNASALAGSVRGVSLVPLPFPGVKTLMVGANAGETESWKSSTDGAAFSDIAVGTLQRGIYIGQVGTDTGSGFLSSGSFFDGQRCVTYNGQLYFPGNDYDADVGGAGTPPPIVRWDGATQVELFTVPANPTSTADTYPLWVIDLLKSQGVIYLAVYDHGGTNPNVKGRVLSFDPSIGTLSLVGNRFGGDTGENARGTPYCLAPYLGQLWCGTNAFTGTDPNMGSIWRIFQGEATWTSDFSNTEGPGFMSLAVYRGLLYAATAAGVGNTARVKVRALAGTWSNSFSAPETGVSYCGGLIVFEDELYTCFFKSTGSILIKKFDGSSWTTTKDIGTDFSTSSHAPGAPFIFEDELYWAFYESSDDTDLTAFIVKKASGGGAWSTALDSVGLRGRLGGVIV